MRIPTFLFICSLLISSCQTNQSSSSKAIELEETTSLGGQKDEHGCLIAAGQTWSQLKKTCIQVFNTGKRLDPVDINLGDAVISAFVIQSEDLQEVELFLPEVETSILVPKITDTSYANSIYRYNHLTSELYINDQLEYKAVK